MYACDFHSFPPVCFGLRMSQQRVCPGMGHRCLAFMAPPEDDPHPTCGRCRGIQCDLTTRCVLCMDLSGDALTRYHQLLHRRIKKRESARRSAARKAATDKSFSPSSSPSSALPPGSQDSFSLAKDPSAADIQPSTIPMPLDIVPLEAGPSGPDLQGTIVPVTPLQAAPPPLGRRPSEDSYYCDLYSLTSHPSPFGG